MAYRETQRAGRQDLRAPSRNIHYSAGQEEAPGVSLLYRRVLLGLQRQLTAVDPENAAELAEYVIRARTDKGHSHSASAQRRLFQELASFIGKGESRRILDWLEEEMRRLNAREPAHDARRFISQHLHRRASQGAPDLDAREETEPSPGLAGLTRQELYTSSTSSSLASLPGPHVHANVHATIVSGEDLLNAKTGGKCPYFPHCTDKHCPHVHPTELCRFFPTCAYGDACLYVHPVLPCRFQDKCINPTCNYQHHSPAVSRAPFPTPSPAVCRFAARGTCLDPHCPFAHPTGRCCPQGAQCAEPWCLHEHPPDRSLPSPLSPSVPQPPSNSLGHNGHPLGRRLTKFINVACRFGQRCARSDCPYIHGPPKKPAMDHPLTPPPMTTLADEAVSSTTSVTAFSTTTSCTNGDSLGAENIPPLPSSSSNLQQQ